MYLFYVPQCSIQNSDVQISGLNGALWDMEQKSYSHQARAVPSDLGTTSAP